MARDAAHPTHHNSPALAAPATIRTALLDNEPWFVANDVCNALGLDTTYGARNHLLKMADSDKKLTTMGDFGLVSDTSARHGGARGNTKLYAVNESGLYKLTMRSDKKEALEFQHWIASEVLPSIRKTGKYDLLEHGRTEMPLPSEVSEALAMALAGLAINVAPF